MPDKSARRFTPKELAQLKLGQIVVEFTSRGPRRMEWWGQVKNSQLAIVKEPGPVEGRGSRFVSVSSLGPVPEESKKDA